MLVDITAENLFIWLLILFIGGYIAGFYYTIKWLK